MSQFDPFQPVSFLHRFHPGKAMFCELEFY